MATTLRRADREARVRHPTHVRTGSILHLFHLSPGHGDRSRSPTTSRIQREQGLRRAVSVNR